MSRTVDLNSDLGESFGAWSMGDDAAMLDIVTTANLACGFHGGDPLVMWRACELAKAKGVAIGAHPSFFDIWGFGRRPIQGERPADIEKQCIYQIGALRAIAAAVGIPVTHVKPHGSLGNMAAVDEGLAMAVARATQTVDKGLHLMVMPGNCLEKAGLKLGLPLIREVFADRTYDEAGNLTPRSQPGAVIHDAATATARVLAMVQDQAITATTGKRLPARVDTICVHGDNPEAVAMARSIRQALEQAGIAVRPFVGGG